MIEHSSNTHTSDPDEKIIDTAETSGITRLSKTESETEGQHLRRVAEELSGSGEERLAALRALLSDRSRENRIAAAKELGGIGSLKSIQMLRDLLVSQHESSWQLAIHGLRTGGSREGWLCLESVASEDAGHLGSNNARISDMAFRRLMAMGRTKMMDRLFRAADGHSRSIPGDIARAFSVKAVESLPENQKNVMQHRLGLVNGSAATPLDTADALNFTLEEVRVLELEAWQAIHSPIQVTGD